MQRSERATVVHRFYRGFKHDAHPMAIMVGVAGALSAFYAKAADIACAPACRLILGDCRAFRGLAAHACGAKQSKAYPGLHDPLWAHRLIN